MDPAIAKNSPDDNALRKARNTLVVTGSSVIAFAAWSILRLILMLSFSGNVTAAEQEEAQKLTDLVTSSKEMAVAFLIVMGVVFVIFVIDFILRLYIGTSARTVGLGKKKKTAYLVFGIILAAFSGLLLGYELFNLPMLLQSDGILGGIISMAVEVTSLIFVLELLVAGFRERKLSKKLGY